MNLLTPDEIANLPGITHFNSLADVPVNQDGVARVQNQLYVGNGGSHVERLGRFKKGPAFGGNYGRRIAIWDSALTNSAGTAALITPTVMPPINESQTQVLQLSYNATQSFGQTNVTTASYTNPDKLSTSFGVWLNNPTSHHLGLKITVFNSGAGKSIAASFNVKPTNGWKFFTISGIIVPDNVVWTFGTDQIAIVRIEQNNATGTWVAGDTVQVGAIYSGTKGRARFLICNDDGTAQVLRPFSTTNVVPASGRSFREIVENYGFKGTLYIVPALIGTPSYMTRAELLDMYDSGWAIGSHSATHPAYLSRGLTSLGPVGYADVNDPYYSVATNDDTAIYNDLMQGIAGLKALGIPNAGNLFALPQGTWDESVMTACIRAGFKHVRGISGYNNAHTLSIGLPTGIRGGVETATSSASGWIHQLDAVQTDGSTTDVQVKQYIDDCITTGATGANYHHGVSSATGVVLDSVLAYLKTKSDAGLIDVMTVEQAAFDDGLFTQ
jgi:hypothetical protein